MERVPCFFVLGAGASVDSGLPTFRGPGGTYVDEQLMTSRATFKMLKKKIDSHFPGETYRLIKKLAPKGSFILNQNIDGYASSTDLKVVDIHVRGLNTGRLLEYEDMVQIGQSLPKDKVEEMFKLTKKGLAYGEHGLCHHRRAGYVLVIGTSMQFPYLRKFINRCKKYGAKVIHINPDPSYGYAVDGDFKRIVTKKNETWVMTTASEGLQLIAEHGIQHVIDTYNQFDCDAS